MKFTKTHEWIKKQGDIAIVGVSHYAESQLGDIVYVELPKVDQSIKAGEEVAVLESTKAAADVYSPLSGMIIEVNTALSQNAELINRSPENEGWIFKIRFENEKEIDELMDELDYKKKNSV